MRSGGLTGLDSADLQWAVPVYHFIVYFQENMIVIVIFHEITVITCTLCIVHCTIDMNVSDTKFSGDKICILMHCNKLCKIEHVLLSNSPTYLLKNLNVRCIGPIPC